LVITAFFMVSSPVSSYIIARYAWHNEIIPWQKTRKK
jgi:multisubunit Na+/H+ antiporter MnhG subunit